MIVFGDLFELRDIHQRCELIEVEHGFVFAVFAKESHILADVHVLEMVCDKTPVATLNAFAECF